MCKPTRATKFIHAAAARMKAGGVDASYNSSQCTVRIKRDGEKDIFMQGDEAASFIDEVHKLCFKYPSLDTDIATHALAEPYTDLWS